MKHCPHCGTWNMHVNVALVCVECGKQMPARGEIKPPRGEPVATTVPYNSAPQGAIHTVARNYED